MAGAGLLAAAGSAALRGSPTSRPLHPKHASHTAPRAFSHLPGHLVWAANFEHGLTTGWDAVHSVSPSDPPYLATSARSSTCGGRGIFSGDNRIQVVQHPVRQGAYAAYMLVENGDKPICAPGERTMLLRSSVNEGEGAEDWYRWSLMLPSNYPTITGTWQVLVEWHGPGSGNQAPVRIYVSGQKIGFSSVESDSNGNPLRSKNLWSAPTDLGRWHDFVAHIRWSFNRRIGFVELWHREQGQATYTQVVPKTFRRTLVYPQSSNYLAVGIYRGPDAGPPAGVYFDGFVQTVVGQVSPPADAAPANGQLAPDPGIEAPSWQPFYSSDGPGTFSSTTDVVHGGTHALKIVSTTSGLSRWLSNMETIRVTPGQSYDVAAWLKTQGAQNARLSVNFWTKEGAYIPATVDAPQTLTGTHDWTQPSLHVTAPAEAVYLRVEFRLDGPGTLWIDDLSVTQ